MSKRSCSSSSSLFNDNSKQLVKNVERTGSSLLFDYDMFYDPDDAQAEDNANEDGSTVEMQLRKQNLSIPSKVKYQSQTSWENSVLQLFTDFSKGNPVSIWLSQTLQWDLNLPMTTSPPDLPGFVQVFMLCVGYPPVLLSLYGTDGSAIDVESFTEETAFQLHDSLLDYCHLDFHVLPCSITLDNFTATSLKTKIELDLKTVKRYFKSPTLVLHKESFFELKKATTALVGATFIPCLLKTTQEKKLWLFLMGKKSRDAMAELIERLHNSGQYEIMCEPDASFNDKVVTLEAAKRISFTKDVTVKCDAVEEHSCLERLKEHVQKESDISLRLEINQTKTQFKGMATASEDINEFAHSGSDDITLQKEIIREDNATGNKRTAGHAINRQDEVDMGQTCNIMGRPEPGSADKREVLLSLQQDSETTFMQANSQVVADSERSRCIPTDDLEKASDILQETGRVILCGFPGTGKTTVGHALLRRCREEGFKPYILSKLEDWHAHIGPGRRSFVLIDAKLGEVRVKRQQYEEWKHILHNMLELINAGDCRVVVTLYPHVLHELQQLETDSQSPMLDSCAVVRLMKEDLDTEMKTELLNFHLNQLPLQPSQYQDVVERIVQADTSDPAFLWCCRYLVDHWQAVEDPATVFTSPAEANSVLLKQMCLHDTHGDSFAAVFVLTMLGKGRFLHRKVRAQAELLEHGFQGHCDDHLAKYENCLLGSVLASQDQGFISRVMYDAAGLALGRSFRLPTLLRVCDVTFLVQHIRVNVTAGQLMRAKKVLDIQVGSKCFDTEARNTTAGLENCQSLIERLHEEVMKGNLKEICPHPALQCPEFLVEMEKYCEKEKHTEHHLLRALDTVYNLPLIYWSVYNKCHVLSEWCINKMNAHQDLHHTLHDTLLACFLSAHLAHELGHKSEQLSFQGLLAAEICQFFTEKKVLSREYIATHFVEKTANFHGMMTGTKKSWQQLYYLCDTDLPIPLNLITTQMSDNKPMSNLSPMASVKVLNDTVTVQVRDREDWYLALRLLADREVDETDRDGNTLLHIATDKGNLEAITLAVKSGASLTKTNNEGLTPYQLAQRRRKELNKEKDSNKLVYNIFPAIRGGNDVRVKTLLCYGSSVHDKDDAGRTGLVVACKEGQGNIADLLIDLGADVNVRVTSRWKGPQTPLFFACRTGLIRTVELLLKHNAVIDTINEWKQTALHYACQCEFPTASADITRLLLDAEADVNAQDWQGDTPLHDAARSGNTETLRRLIHQKADLNAKDNNGRTPLHDAYTESRPDIITQLVEAGAETGRVHQAVVRGDVDALMTLLQQGADVNQHDTSMGCSPLHAACLMGRTDIVTWLTQHGAKVNAVDNRNKTPLHIACHTGVADIVTYLNQHGAKVNAVDDMTKTPLHYACAAGQTRVARQLIDEGADVSARDKSTPLDKAADKGNREIVVCLLEHGAQVDAAADYNITPLHTACNNGHTETADSLLQHGANVNAASTFGTPLHTACENGHTQTAQFLLQHGANVNAVSKWNETPLHAACVNGHTDTAHYLLQHGANVNAVSTSNKTPLHTACKNGHTETAQCLLQHGADVNVVSEWNQTPLHRACRNGHTQIALCLLQHGANVNVVSEGYGTPLDVARLYAQHCDDMVTLLAQHGAVSRRQVTRKL